ncbi:MAG: hypothetical protein HYW69_02490 [Candidatus Nealsonbacteria bacterium]|nr:hypothetical protein [Candidatus Nealsonbacteria bacterium]
MPKTALKDKKLDNLIRWTIVETVQEVLRDPDLGLELQEWAQKRLKKHPKKFISLGEITKK